MRHVGACGRTAYAVVHLIWRRAIFPEACATSIVAATAFHDRVRNGNGWDHRAIDTRNRYQTVYNGMETVTTRYISSGLSNFHEQPHVVATLNDQTIIMLDLCVIEEKGYRTTPNCLLLSLTSSVSSGSGVEKSMPIPGERRTFLSSPRSISTPSLNTLPCVHAAPINGVVYSRPYQITLWEVLSWGVLRA